MKRRNRQAQDYAGEVAMVRAEEAAYQARLDAVKAKVIRGEPLNEAEQNLWNNNFCRDVPRKVI